MQHEDWRLTFIVLRSRAVKPMFPTRLVNPNLPQILKLNLFVEDLVTSRVVGWLLASQAEQLLLVAAETRHHLFLTSRGQPLLGRRDPLENRRNCPVAMVLRIPLLRLPLPAGGDYWCPPHPIPTGPTLRRGGGTPPHDRVRALCVLHPSGQERLLPLLLVANCASLLGHYLTTLFPRPSGGPGVLGVSHDAEQVTSNILGATSCETPVAPQ